MIEKKNGQTAADEEKRLERREFLRSVGGASMMLMSLSLLRNVKEAKAQPVPQCDPSSIAGQLMQDYISGQGFQKVVCCRTPFAQGEGIVHIFRETENRLATLFELREPQSGETSAFGGIFDIINWETLEGSVEMLRFEQGAIVPFATTMGTVLSDMTFADPLSPNVSSSGCAGCAACSACAACLTDSIIPDLEGLGLAGLGGLAALL